MIDLVVLGNLERARVSWRIWCKVVWAFGLRNGDEFQLNFEMKYENGVVVTTSDEGGGALYFFLNLMVGVFFLVIDKWIPSGNFLPLPWPF